MFVVVVLAELSVWGPYSTEEEAIEVAKLEFPRTRYAIRQIRSA